MLKLLTWIILKVIERENQNGQNRSTKDTLIAINDYNKGIPIKKVAEKLGRSEAEIESKIEKLRYEMLVNAFDNLFKEIAVIFQIPYRRLCYQIEILLDDTISETLKKKQKELED